jgi:hypothetical protein
MLKGATGTTPLPYPTLITVLLRHFRINLADEYSTSIDGQKFEIGQSVLHRAGIFYAADNWYIEELGIEGITQKKTTLLQMILRSPLSQSRSLFHHTSSGSLSKSHR